MAEGVALKTQYEETSQGRILPPSPVVCKRMNIPKYGMFTHLTTKLTATIKYIRDYIIRGYKL